MWMIWSMLAMFIALSSACAFYSWWNNRQVDRYEAWKKQQEEQENNTAKA